MRQRIFQNIRRVVSVSVPPSSSKVVTSFVLSLSIFLIILCGIPESSSAAVRSDGRIGGSFGSSSSRSIRHRPSSSPTSPRRNHSNRSRSSRVYDSSNEPTSLSGSSSSRSVSSNTRELSDSVSQSYNSEQPNKRRSGGYRGYNRGYLGIGRRPFYSGYPRGTMRGYNHGYPYPSPYAVHVPYAVVIARSIGRIFFVSVFLLVAFFIL